MVCYRRPPAGRVTPESLRMVMETYTKPPISPHSPASRSTCRFRMKQSQAVAEMKAAMAGGSR